MPTDGPQSTTKKDVIRLLNGTPAQPWENPDGSTNVDGWLAAYADDSNNFWRTETGHIMNVVDELLWRLERAQANLPDPEHPEYQDPLWAAP